MTLYQFFISVHLLGLCLGLGACSISYEISGFGFFKPDILRSGVKVFPIISRIIWVGLFLLIGSGIGLVIVAKEAYGDVLHSWPFYLKLIATGIAALNGLYLNFIVTPALEKAVELESFTRTKEYKKAMILGLIGGVISAGCWYGAFALGIYVFRILAG
jgi:uncharacterized membrane protein